MDENPRENSPNKEDDTQDKDFENEEPDSETNNIKTLYPKILVGDLKRQPLHQRKGQIESRGSDVSDGEKRQNERKKEKEENKRTNGQEVTTDSLGSLTSYFFIICLVLVSVLFFFCWTKLSSYPQNEQLNVPELMRDLKTEFKNQSSFTYRVIEAAINRASSENSDSPGIIVLISSRKAKETTNKLAERLGQLLSKPLDSVLIDSGSSSTTMRLKKEIEVTIRGNLTENRMRAVLVKDLDRIPFDAAMIFHGYCDHENAPFKKVVYVMTASVEENIPFLNTSGNNQWDVLATKRLSAAWSDSGQDQVASLISRLTGSVAAIV